MVVLFVLCLGVYLFNFFFATYWENSCSFGLRYVSWYKSLIVSLVFSHLGFWSGNLFLIAPFPDLCLLVPFLFLSGQFDLRLSMLECSPSNYIVRTIRDNWVKEIKERILKDPGRAPVILPATIDATQCQSKEDFNPQNLPTYTVFALGGNHLVTAMKEVLIDHPELAYLRLIYHFSHNIAIQFSVLY